MDERGKIKNVERSFAAWNAGDLVQALAETTEDFEWDQRRSSIPGEMELYRGHEAFLAFARRWRQTLGSTHAEIDEAVELPDGRLFVLVKQAGAGAHSGAPVESVQAHIYSFEGEKQTRCEVFMDTRTGRAAAGLTDPDG